MTTQISQTTDELGYFYDGLHGRIAIDDLPEPFRLTLKSALSSAYLSRLKRISQLGHTSVCFFSATHTRFSHAIGTMLTMDKLFRQVCERGLPSGLYDEYRRLHGNEHIEPFVDAKSSIHCHMLLAALYQDVGELPFQKATGGFFVPVDSMISNLKSYLPRANPAIWKVKDVFTISALIDDFSRSGDFDTYGKYDLEFLSYLITGDGAHPESKLLPTLLQMMNGTVDADRLDYVYRDAAATIGSLSRPSTVLDSIISYDCEKVVVSDPRPVSDFLSTRMRLWTYVYFSAEARFMQVVLRSVLEGCNYDANTSSAFATVGIKRQINLQEFLLIDDNMLLDGIKKLDGSLLQPFRQEAKKLLENGTLGYECKALKRNHIHGELGRDESFPKEVFFDLLLDIERHQLYRPESVHVRHGLISSISPTLPLEECSGSFSLLYSDSNTPMVVSDCFYLYYPHARRERRYNAIKNAISDGRIYSIIEQEHANRMFEFPTDTIDTFKDKNFPNIRPVHISFCSVDILVAKRVVRELHAMRRPYKIIYNLYDGIGDTVENNSAALIERAQSVIALVSAEYIQRALTNKSCISVEVRAMHKRSGGMPIVPIGVDAREKISSIQNWNWGVMFEGWNNSSVAISNDAPLKSASDAELRAAVLEALRRIDDYRHT